MPTGAISLQWNTLRRREWQPVNRSMRATCGEMANRRSWASRRDAIARGAIVILRYFQGPALEFDRADPSEYLRMTVVLRFLRVFNLTSARLGPSALHRTVVR